jgi:hypothetical protein
VEQPIATVLAALIAAAASVFAAVYSHRAKTAALAVEQRMRITQARLDERDLIAAAGGFIIPIENDAMWSSYHRILEIDAAAGAADWMASRKSASLKVRPQAPPLAPPIVAMPLRH